MNFNRISGILTFAILTSVSASANSQFQLLSSSFKDSSMKASLKMSGANLDSELNNAKLFNLQIGTQFKHKFTKQIDFNLDAAINLGKGSSDSLYGNNGYEASSGLSLKEAKLAWSPLKNVQLQAGAINQQVINNKLLVSKTAFLGAREVVSFNTLGLNVELSANQSTPTNANTSNRLDKVEDSSVVFYVESLKIEKSVKGVGSVKSTTSHFAYDNLTNSIAAASIDLGNTVGGFGEEDSSFTNSYIGWAQTLEAEKIINNDYSVKGKFSYVINTAAKDGSNEARVYAAKVTKHVGDTNYSLAIENFNTESDASVAYYNAGKYGHSNKKGNLVGFAYEDKREQLVFTASFGSNKEIKENTYQESENLIFFSLGKSYDLF